VAGSGRQPGNLGQRRRGELGLVPTTASTLVSKLLPRLTLRTAAKPTALVPLRLAVTAQQSSSSSRARASLAGCRCSTNSTTPNQFSDKGWSSLTHSPTIHERTTMIYPYRSAVETAGIYLPLWPHVHAVDT